MHSSFQKYVSDFGTYSWIVLFVEAPADEVAAAYGKYTNQQVHGQIPVADIGGANANYGPVGAVAQLKNCGWSTVFHMLGNWDFFDPSPIAHCLDARILTFQAQDTAGIANCELLVSSGLTKYYTEHDADADNEFREMTDQPPLDAKIVDSYDELLESFGIATAQLYCDENRSVFADTVDLKRIEKLVFVGDAPQ